MTGPGDNDDPYFDPDTDSPFGEEVFAELFDDPFADTTASELDMNDEYPEEQP